MYIYDVIHFLDHNLLYILKAILLEQNIVIYSHKPSNLSKFMISILEFLPGCLSRVN